MNVEANVFDVKETRTVAALTGLAVLGVLASLALGGTTNVLMHAAWYITGSGAAAGGASAGAGAVAAAGITASSLTGAALAAGVLAGGVGVVAAGA